MRITTRPKEFLKTICLTPLLGNDTKKKYPGATIKLEDLPQDEPYHFNEPLDEPQNRDFICKKGK